MNHSSVLRLGFGPGFTGTVRVGLTASSGIAHEFENFITPGIISATHIR